MEIAGKLRRALDPTAKNPGKSWLDGFLKRSKHLKKNEKKHIDVPGIRENGELLVELFFEKLQKWETAQNITSGRVWNLDECGFQVSETQVDSIAISLAEGNNSESGQVSALVYVLETISGDGRTLAPLMIYKGVDIMEAWFPQDVTSKDILSISANTAIFEKWVTTCFPFTDEWQILIIDGHKFQVSPEFVQSVLTKKVAPLYLPSHLPNVLQRLDKSPFGTTKRGFRQRAAYQFAQEILPSKITFITNYMTIRPRVYAERTLKSGWKRIGIFPRDVSIAVDSFNAQMDLVQNEIQEPEEPEEPRVASPINVNLAGLDLVLTGIMYPKGSENCAPIIWKKKRIKMLSDTMVCKEVMVAAINRGRELEAQKEYTSRRPKD